MVTQELALHYDAERYAASRDFSTEKIHFLLLCIFLVMVPPLVYNIRILRMFLYMQWKLCENTVPKEMNKLIVVIPLVSLKMIKIGRTNSAHRRSSAIHFCFGNADV